MSIEAEFHCTTAWHMARFKSKSADVVYDFACNIAYKTRKFYASVDQTARYLGRNPKTVRKAYRELTKNGWFLLLEKGCYSPNVYEPVLNHDAWAGKNQGQCCEKSSLPWTTENDALGQAIWASAGGRIKPKSHNIKTIRKMMKELDCSSEEVTAEFKVWYPNQCHAPKFVMGQFIRHLRRVMKQDALKAAA